MKTAFTGRIGFGQHKYAIKSIFNYNKYNL